MYLCSNYHDEICYDERNCPYCKTLDDHQADIGDYEKQIDELKDEIDELKDEIKEIKLRSE